MERLCAALRVLFIGGTLFLLGTARAAEVGTSLYAQGQKRISVSAGYGSSNNQNYAVLGLGAGYCLLDGLEAGVDGTAWLGSKPHLYTVSPELRYVLLNAFSLKPYVGGFYKHSFYDSLPDRDSAGGRAGILWPVAEHMHVSAGLVYEKYFSCDTSLYSDCSQVYPEIGLTFTY